MQRAVGLALCLGICCLWLWAAAETQVVLTLGGDCVLGTREEWKQDPDTFDTLVAGKGFGWCFEKIGEVFRQDDMSLVNLECVLQDSAKGLDRKKQYRFRGCTGYTDILTCAGIEQVNLANNHIVDYGSRGRKSTRTALQNAGIAFSGYGDLYVFEKDGIKIGFGGCRETAYRQNRSVVAKEIQKLRKLGCDAIVYSMHWGEEYSPKHSRMQEIMAQAAVKAGADLVVGTHPHCVQGMEHRDGAVVLYSLGNLVFGGTHKMTTFDALAVQATLRFGEAGYEGVQIKLLPVLTSGDIPQNNFQPVWAQGEDKERILKLVQKDSGMKIEEAMFFGAE